MRLNLTNKELEVEKKAEVLKNKKLVLKNILPKFRKMVYAFYALIALKLKKFIIKFYQIIKIC